MLSVVAHPDGRSRDHGRVPMSALSPDHMLLQRARAISPNIAESSMVAGMLHWSPSAIFFMVPRRRRATRGWIGSFVPAALNRLDRNGYQLAGGSISANRLIEALMSHPEQFQTFTIIGLALGFVLIALGIAINWVTESKIEARELALLASVFLLLCILIRKRIAQRPSP
jgi:hypothetical protein